MIQLIFGNSQRSEYGQATGSFIIREKAYPGVVKKFFSSFGSLPAIVPIAIALLVGALCGFINGIIIAKTKIPPFIATLGMQLLARGATYIYSSGQPISYLTEDFKYLGKGTVFGFLPVPVIIFFLVVFITWVLLRKRKFGSSIYAIGGNVNAAVVSGVNVPKTLTMIYTYAGLLCGVAACINTARVGNAQPAVGNGFEFDAIIACVVGGISQQGGIGTVGGCVAGILLYGIIANGMNMLGISPYWQNVVKGAVIVISVILDTRKNSKKS